MPVPLQCHCQCFHCHAVKQSRELIQMRNTSVNCVYIYVCVVYIYKYIVWMFSFHLAEFRRCSTQTHVRALQERKGRSGWMRQWLHKLASLPKRLSSNCAWTLKHRCEEMGGDPDRASASLQSFDDRRTKVAPMSAHGLTEPAQYLNKSASRKLLQPPVTDIC